MFKNTFSKKFIFLITSLFISILIAFIILKPLFLSDEIIIPYGLQPFDICQEHPIAWKNIKKYYIIFYILSTIICSNSIYSLFFKKENIKNKSNNIIEKPNGLYLLVGKDFSSNTDIFISEKGLYQNILITGTIGTGKTSSAMYPFTKQLINYKSFSNLEKIGMLILDVKGNFYNEVAKYVKDCKRDEDLIIISLHSSIKYNPLDKPNLKPIVLANRLKTILTLFSKNNSESYWLDKAEQVLAECIKLCRLYNNGYVTFEEIHKLVNFPNYYSEKISNLRNIFQSGKLSQEDIYNLLSSIEFFEKEFYSLDNRTLSILKSEITRITSPFISDYNVLKTFSPSREELNFFRFSRCFKKW